MRLSWSNICTFVLLRHNSVNGSISGERSGASQKLYGTCVAIDRVNKVKLSLKAKCSRVWNVSPSAMWRTALNPTTYHNKSIYERIMRECDGRACNPGVLRAPRYNAHQCKIYDEGSVKMKANKLNVRNTEAIMHMIGQVEHIFDRGVSIAEVAAWMKVSKPTARRFMDKMVDCRMVKKYDKVWRKGHSIQHLYRLSGAKMVDFHKDCFRLSYQLFIADVHGFWIKTQ